MGRLLLREGTLVLLGTGFTVYLEVGDLLVRGLDLRTKQSMLLLRGLLVVEQSLVLVKLHQLLAEHGVGLLVGVVLSKVGTQRQLVHGCRVDEHGGRPVLWVHHLRRGSLGVATKHVGAGGSTVLAHLLRLAPIADVASIFQGLQTLPHAILDQPPTVRALTQS